MFWGKSNQLIINFCSMLNLHIPGYVIPLSHQQMVPNRKKPMNLWTCYKLLQCLFFDCNTKNSIYVNCVDDVWQYLIHSKVGNFSVKLLWHIVQLDWWLRYYQMTISNIVFLHSEENLKFSKTKAMAIEVKVSMCNIL